MLTKVLLIVMIKLNIVLFPGMDKGLRTANMFHHVDKFEIYSIDTQEGKSMMLIDFIRKAS